MPQKDNNQPKTIKNGNQLALQRLDNCFCNENRIVKKIN